MSEAAKPKPKRLADALARLAEIERVLQALVFSVRKFEERTGKKIMKKGTYSGIEFD